MILNQEIRAFFIHLRSAIYIGCQASPSEHYQEWSQNHLKCALQPVRRWRRPVCMLRVHCVCQCVSHFSLYMLVPSCLCPPFLTVSIESFISFCLVQPFFYIRGTHHFPASLNTETEGVIVDRPRGNEKLRRGAYHREPLDSSLFLHLFLPFSLSLSPTVSVN